MHFGINVPNFGPFADPRLFADLARDVEESGWDGLFVWDHMLVWDGNVVADPWILLAGAALRTERIRLGPMVTPLPRRRPWKVARETVTLDHLSGGRVILGVGIGFPPDPEFAAFGEVVDARNRADLLDESLEILTGLWSGEPFAHQGRHFRLREMVFSPRPVQQPRIPIWVAGMWPHRRPFRRAARFDGVFPILAGEDEPMVTPSDLAEAVGYLRGFRTGGGAFDVATYVELPDDPHRAGDTVEAFREAGATWIQVGPAGQGSEPLDSFRRRIRRGPPGR